jgi:hypothetical protein
VDADDPPSRAGARGVRADDATHADARIVRSSRATC